MGFLFWPLKDGGVCDLENSFGFRWHGAFILVSVPVPVPVLVCILFYATHFVITFSPPSLELLWRSPPGCVFGFGFRVALLSAWLSIPSFCLFIYFGVIKFHALVPFSPVSVYPPNAFSQRLCF